MAGNKSLLLVITILFMASAASADNVTRTISNSTLLKDDPTSRINVSIIAQGNNFGFYEINETFPTNLTITTSTDNISIVVDGDIISSITAGQFTFSTEGLVQFYGINNLNITALNYSIKSNENTNSGTFNLTGSYRNSNLSKGTISNATIIISENATSLISDKRRYFDTNGDHSFSKDEILNAIAVGYFGVGATPRLTLTEIMDIIVNYYFNSRQIL